MCMVCLTLAQRRREEQHGFSWFQALLVDLRRLCSKDEARHRTRSWGASLPRLLDPRLVPRAEAENPP